MDDIRRRERNMALRKVIDNLSIQTCLTLLVLFIELHNYGNLTSKIEKIWSEVYALKSMTNLDKGDTTESFEENCCLKYHQNYRHRRSLSELTSRSIEADDSALQNKCEKGDKGDKGNRGPPGLPGLRGDSCGCFTTEEPETVPPPTIEPRQHDCSIKIIGIPLHQEEDDYFWGSWSKDTNPDSSFRKYFWVTKHFEGRFLYAYEDLRNVKSGIADLIIDLSPHYYFGTGHVIFNGSFLYHEAGSNRLNKFDLRELESTASVVIPRAHYRGDSYLYSNNYTYFDLNVDENGLWLLYTSTDDGNNILVSNLDPGDLNVRFTWKISSPPKSFGGSFIVCGKLYLIKNITTPIVTLDTLYDLYTEEWQEINLIFKNPYRLNTMISYNPIDKTIYSWDRGHLLSYPLLLD